MSALDDRCQLARESYYDNVPTGQPEGSAIALESAIEIATRVRITDEMIDMFMACGTGGYGDVTDVRAGLKAALGVAGFGVES